METEDPFASLGGLGSGLGANFGPRNAPFRSQSFNVGSNSGGKKDKMQDPAVEHDLYVSLDDINKVCDGTISGKWCEFNINQYESGLTGSEFCVIIVIKFLTSHDLRRRLITIIITVRFSLKNISSFDLKISQNQPNYRESPRG